jgi:hypothetical protein
MKSMSMWILLLISVASAQAQSIPTLPGKYVQRNSIPARFQWNEFGGYCGEVSMISAGLYYGQYLSQYAVRRIASPGGNQNSQLLLGMNDTAAAKALRLKHEAHTSADSQEFLAWVKHHVAQGHPVIIGIMDNSNILGGSEDPEYDHIVPVMGFSSNKPLTEGYDPSDEILFSDNGLYTPNASGGNVQCTPREKDRIQYYFSYPLSQFLKTREHLENSSQVYALLKDPDSALKRYNYGIAIIGVEGDDETLPARVDTNVDYEAPCIGPKGDRPEPMSLKLTITISQMKSGVEYNVYRYNHVDDVPRGQFNKNSKKGSLWKSVSVQGGGEWSETFQIKSDEEVFFRVVKAD